MICHEIEIEAETMIAISDLHVGNNNTKLEAIQKAVNTAKKEGSNVLILGDLAEAISAGDKRFDFGCVDPQFITDDMIGKQYKWVERVLKPISGQIIGIMVGNHDSKIAKNCQIDMVAHLCDNLSIKYLKDLAITRLTYKKSGKKNSYDIFSIHGYVGGRTTGPKVNAIESMSNAYTADLYLAGHSHYLFHVSAPQKYMTRFGHEGHRLLHYANTGSFLDGHQENKKSYAEAWGYKPLKIGYIKANFNPYGGEMKLEEVVL